MEERKADFDEEGVQVGNPSKKQSTGSSSRWTQDSESGTSKQILKCPTCKKRHNGVCHRATGSCFRCGQQGLVKRNCPKGATGSGSEDRHGTSTSESVRVNTGGSTEC